MFLALREMRRAKARFGLLAARKYRGDAPELKRNSRCATCDMQRSEHMTLDLVKRKNEIEELNRLGRQGWEAVAMVSSWGVRVAFRVPHRAVEAAATERG